MEFDTHELAWAAGFMDGEGHFNFWTGKHKHKTRAYGSLRASAHQVDRRALDRLQAATGLGHINGPYLNKGRNGQPFYLWTVNNFHDSQAAIAMLWRWLGPVKRAQVTAACLTARDYAARPKLPKGPKRKTTGVAHIPVTSAHQEAQFDLSA